MLNEIKHGDGRELALGVRRESCLLDLAAIDTPGAEQLFTGVRAKFGVLNCKSIPPHLLCEVCKITSRGATIQEPLLSRGTCPQLNMAQLVGIRSALHFANDLRIQFTLVVNKVGRVVNLPEGLVVGLRKNGLQAALWASPMIWNFLAKTQNHFCGTGKAWIHGNPLAHFNEARTTTPRGVPSGASAVTSKVPHWVSTLVPAGGNLQPDRHNKVARSGPVSLLARCARASPTTPSTASRSEEHTSELQSPVHLVCRLLLEKKKNKIKTNTIIKKKKKKKKKKKQN